MATAAKPRAKSLKSSTSTDRHKATAIQFFRVFLKRGKGQGKLIMQTFSKSKAEIFAEALNIGDEYDPKASVRTCEITRCRELPDTAGA